MRENRENLLFFVSSSQIRAAAPSITMVAKPLGPIGIISDAMVKPNTSVSSMEHRERPM